MISTRLMRAISLSLLFAPFISADTDTRIEYKLGRVKCDTSSILDKSCSILDVVNQIDETTMSTFDKVCEILEVSCNQIDQARIDAASGNLTLTESGVYCLVENVTGTVTIGVNNVCIDLSCHSIDAGTEANAIVVDGVESVSIYNGCVINSSEAGILVSDSQDVELRELTLRDHSVNAVEFDSTAGIFVHNCNFARSLSALVFITSTDGKVTCNSIYDQLSLVAEPTGIIIDRSSAIWVSETVVRNTNSEDFTVAGIRLLDSKNITLERVEVFDSLATTSQAHGILIDSCSDTKLIRSQVHTNFSSGVEIVGSNTAICIIECLAKDNDKGFSVAATATLIDSLVQDSRAIRNTTVGFEHLTTPLDTVYIGNEAHGNGTDYSIAGGILNLWRLTISTGAITFVSGDDELTRWSNIESV